MEVFQHILPILGWLAIIAAVAGVVYSFFRYQERKDLRSRPGRQAPSAEAPALQVDLRPRQSTAQRAAPLPGRPAFDTPPALTRVPERPAVEPPLDARRATELAIAGLPPTLPITTHATLDSIRVLYSGKRWATLSLRTTDLWGWAICGATRSGKGNVLQLIALSALGLGPEAVEVWVLDPKGGLDYGFCTRLAHTRLYTDGLSTADGSLTQGYEAAFAEMHRRQNILSTADARNIKEYHAKGNDPLPYLVLIADEIANIDSAQRQLLTKLACMSAASGIVLLAATQYPTADVLPTQVQTNLHNRLVFRLPSSRYTDVALGLGRGERNSYDPSAISGPGIAILRRSGQEVVGRVPELTDDLRQELITSLRERWPRAAQSDRQPAVEVGEDPLLDSLMAALGVPATTVQWTDRHLLIATWIAQNPKISNREIARRLFPTNTGGGGEAAVKAKQLRQEVESLLKSVPNALVQASQDVQSSVEPEKPEGAEH
jgi:hypothetical protein